MPTYTKGTGDHAERVTAELGSLEDRRLGADGSGWALDTTGTAAPARSGATRGAARRNRANTDDEAATGGGEA